MLNTSSAFHFHANKCLMLKKIVDHQQKLVHPNSKCQKVRWGILQLISKRQQLQKFCLSAFLLFIQKVTIYTFDYLITRDRAKGYQRHTNLNLCNIVDAYFHRPWKTYSLYQSSWEFTLRLSNVILFVMVSVYMFLQNSSLSKRKRESAFLKC